MEAAKEDVYLRYYTGHKGRFGHEFLEFEFTSAGRLRYANNSNYRNDTLIRREVYVSGIVLQELRRIIESSEILKEDDSRWPEQNKSGKQELEIEFGTQHICFATSKIGSFSEVQQCDDPAGLSVFYYLVQDLKAFVFSLIGLHFRIKPEMGSSHGKSADGSPVGNTTDAQTASPETYTWNRSSITQSYILGRVIGHGHFSTVRLAIRDGYNYAVKTIDKRKLSGQLSLILTELDIISAMDHPNIIRFYEVFDDERYVHIVMEYCSGGELFDRLICQGQFCEDYVQKLARQMLAAITYLHKHNICHRDIKPENFLFESASEEAELKIIDFGLSKKLSSGGLTMHTKAGTSVYMSPEVFEGTYDLSCDVWSFGVTLYIMLSGRMPFPDLSDAMLYDYVSTMRYNLEIPEFKHVSKAAKQLIRRLMCPKAVRYTAEQALNDPWFSMHKPKALNPEVVHNLIVSKADTKFKREALAFLVHRLSENQLHRLRETFESIDDSQNGYLTVTDLEKTLHQMDLNVSHEEISKIVSQVSYGGSGKINYTEFLVATFNALQTTSEEMLWITFKHFDKDDSGYITATDLQELATRDGRIFTDEEVQQVIQEGTQGNGNQVNFEMFCRLMKGSGQTD